LTRIITPTQIGILAVLSLIVNLAQTINGAAFQSAATKYVAEYVERDNGAAAGVAFQALKVSLTISVPVAGFVFLYAGLLSRALLGTISQAQLFRYLALDVLVYGGVLPVANGAVLGAKRFRAAGAIGTAGAILRQSLIIILILFLKDFIGLV
jgi:O-antigen/teichoic acid export membrane protein